MNSPEARPLTELEAARVTIDSLVAQNRLAISLLRACSRSRSGHCTYCDADMDEDHAPTCELNAFLENL